jgi:hypothetical protein
MRSSFDMSTAECEDQPGYHFDTVHTPSDYLQPEWYTPKCQRAGASAA